MWDADYLLIFNGKDETENKTCTADNTQSQMILLSPFHSDKQTKEKLELLANFLD